VTGGSSAPGTAPVPGSRLGVLGWPVAHSRSPAIHNAALAALGMDGWRYQLLPVPPELLDETTRGLGAAGFVGANVTIPHKHAALALASEASAAAIAIGAANTLTFAPDGAIAAANTDAPGLIAALDLKPRGISALVLGAGGSARAAVWALREAGAREISVWNRTPERAEQLAHELGARPVRAPVPADLLINCTSVGLPPALGAIRASAGVQPAPGAIAASGGAPPPEAAGRVERSASEREELNLLGLTFDQVGNYSYVADMVYRPGSTQLLAAAAEHGARTLDGLEILLAQGALSFELWTGRKPPLDVMRAALRAPHSRGAPTHLQMP
jgi:shikimate dehydrogenase